MSIRYLVTKDEETILLFLYRTGWKKEGETGFLTREKRCSLEKMDNRKKEETYALLKTKGYLYEKNGIIYLENLILAFLDSMEHAEKVIEIEENRLYLKKDIIIWQTKDWRQKDGYALTPYPNVKEWYEEEKDNYVIEAEKILEIENWKGEKLDE